MLVTDVRANYEGFRMFLAYESSYGYAETVTNIKKFHLQKVTNMVIYKSL